MSIVYLGLGSNLGDREKNLREAVVRLEAQGLKSIKLSTIIETDPVGVPPGMPPQGLFLNAVLRAETNLSPKDLLHVCQKIERQLGRERPYKNSPRTIDIDILLYDDIQLNTQELIIPHPRMRERDFVMRPLNELLKGKS